MSDNNYKFQAPPIVNTSNRVNSSRQPPGNTKGRANLRLANIIPAGKSLMLPADGTLFYLRTATAQIDIRPSGGVFSTYGVGEGENYNLENTFHSLEIKNNNTFSVVFEIIVGFQGFIDNKLILANTLQPQIAYPTYPSANAATVVNIVDRSGSQIEDINGNDWYALNRVAVVISNIDAGVTLLLQKADAASASGPSICAIFPLTVIRLDVSGDYRLTTGGGNINAIVSELYAVIAATAST